MAELTWESVINQLRTSNMDANRKAELMGHMKRDYGQGMAPSMSYFNQGALGTLINPQGPPLRPGEMVSQVGPTTYAPRQLETSNELDSYAAEARQRALARRQPRRP